MKITKKYIQKMIQEELVNEWDEKPVVQEFMPQPGELPAEGERMEPTPSMEDVAKTLDEAANVLIAGKVLVALHHGGAKEGAPFSAPLYERANTVLNELINLRDELRGRK